MANKYRPNLIPFKGEHPYFQDGEVYTYRQYSAYTYTNCLDGRGVGASTMKGRLQGEQFCTPRHLLSIADFIATSEKVKKYKGFCKESRMRVLNQPRLETKSEQMMGKWLKVKL